MSPACTSTHATTTTQHGTSQPLPPPTSTPLFDNTTPTHYDESSDPDADDVNSDTPSHEIPIDLIEDDMEPWEDFIRRCTYDVELKMKKLGIEDWISGQRWRKWNMGVANDQRNKWTLKAALLGPQATCNLQRSTQMCTTTTKMD